MAMGVDNDAVGLVGTGGGAVAPANVDSDPWVGEPTEGPGIVGGEVAPPVVVALGPADGPHTVREVEVALDVAALLRLAGGLGMAGAVPLWVVRWLVEADDFVALRVLRTLGILDFFALGQICPVRL